MLNAFTSASRSTCSRVNSTPAPSARRTRLWIGGAISCVRRHTKALSAFSRARWAKNKPCRILPLPISSDATSRSSFEPSTQVFICLPISTIGPAFRLLGEKTVDEHGYDTHHQQRVRRIFDERSLHFRTPR